MAAIPATVDILALAKDAFRLYYIYRDAQDRYRALCEDIIGLESTLKILGNKLVFQGTGSNSGPNTKPSDIADEGPGGSLDPEESAALQHLIQQAHNLLQELHARVPATKLPRGLYRLRWSESEVVSIRLRITALNSNIAAFSSSLAVSHISFSARTEHSQQQILSTLREVLSAVQNGPPNRSQSPASTLVAPPEAPSDPLDDSFLQNLLHDMQKHGVSDVHLGEGGQLVVRSVSPGLMPTSGTGHRQSWTSTNHQLAWDNGPVTYEVLSAVYGPRVLTKRMQRLVDNHSVSKGHPLEFVIKNETMGGDPLYGDVKAFAMIWRKRAFRDGRTLYSEPQHVLGEEDDIATIHLDAPLPCVEHQQKEEDVGSREGMTQIVFASWFDMDVTARVANLVASGHTSITATNENLHVDDPKPGYVKSLSICWTYYRGTSAVTPSIAEFQTATVLTGQQLEVPPGLHMLCASKGDLEITDIVQAMVSRNQTLTLDASNTALAVLDPRPGVRKTISIAYRYGARAMQLLVVGEGQGVVELNPTTTSSSIDVGDDGGIFDLDASVGVPLGQGGHPNPATVVALVWGLKLLSLETPSLRSALQERLLPCNNDFLGVDGWEYTVKTCQVFVQRAAVAAECAKVDPYHLHSAIDHVNLQVSPTTTATAALDHGSNSTILSLGQDQAGKCANPTCYAVQTLYKLLAQVHQDSVPVTLAQPKRRGIVSK
ncbi:hypothetical protein A9K55_000004 [Cordyceps militaris]|uniref:Uncharacterized protein n=1 Tax=Cordyceps militaris TaxID=73501 RepID=A0A2H4SVI1_CORMI|nr:hypothetical protein A9K55_000004 [Cordyceps militaris]